MMRRTPLFAAHQRQGGKLIEFGGWEMPVQYTSIMDEHQTVRTAAGIFDISHMGEVLVSGPAAAEFLNRTLTNDIRKLQVGLGQYTLMCNLDGGVIDDLYAYQLEPAAYLLIINASRIDDDFAWLAAQAAADVKHGRLQLQNVSDVMGAVAVQGPATVHFIDGCFSGPSTGGMVVSTPTDLAKNQVAQFGFRGEKVWVSRTGYTGEDGFEVVCDASLVESVWEAVLGQGKAHGLKPAGLGARDTLRTEVCYPLYGHELNEQTTPLEAGVGFFVALDKGEFNGRARLSEQKANGTKKKLVAFKLTEKGAPPRPGYPIWSAGANPEPIGLVCSGTQSPSLNLGIGMGFVPPEYAKAQTAIQIEARGKKCAAVVVPKPIYRKPD
jgi:aminomethyltransferase